MEPRLQQPLLTEACTHHAARRGAAPGASQHVVTQPYVPLLGDVLRHLAHRHGTLQPFLHLGLLLHHEVEEGVALLLLAHGDGGGDGAAGRLTKVKGGEAAAARWCLPCNGGPGTVSLFLTGPPHGFRTRSTFFIFYSRSVYFIFIRIFIPFSFRIIVYSIGVDFLL